MKKSIVVLSFLLTAGVASAFTVNDPDPDQKVLEGFKKEFPTAQEVKWTVQEEFDKAIFVLAGRRVIAYFTKQGELEGSVRDIFFDQLPLAVMTTVNKRYPDAGLLEVREINNAEGAHYKLRLEFNGKKLIVRVNPDGSVRSTEKVAK